MTYLLGARKGDRKVQKWTTYISTYERYLSKFRGCDVNVLELGVQSGGSQDMWLAYLGEGAQIFGVDLERKTLNLNDGRRHNMVGDIGDRAFLKSVCAAVKERTSNRRLDIVIDDASHINWHQILAFETIFFGCLSPHHGVYLVEDIDTSYKPAEPFRGGVGVKGTFVEYAKAKIDELQSYWSCADGPVVGQDGTCRDGKQPTVPPTDFTRATTAIHVHDGIFVFEKMPHAAATIIDTGGIKIHKHFVAYENKMQAAKMGLSVGDEEDPQ